MVSLSLSIYRASQFDNSTVYHAQKMRVNQFKINAMICSLKIKGRKLLSVAMVSNAWPCRERNSSTISKNAKLFREGLGFTEELSKNKHMNKPSLASYTLRLSIKHKSKEVSLKKKQLLVKVQYLFSRTEILSKCVFQILF